LISFFAQGVGVTSNTTIEVSDDFAYASNINNLLDNTDLVSTFVLERQRITMNGAQASLTQRVMLGISAAGRNRRLLRRPLTVRHAATRDAADHPRLTLRLSLAVCPVPAPGVREVGSN
jgi:hypothetical protein